MLDHLGGGFDLLYFVDSVTDNTVNPQPKASIPHISISSKLHNVISAFKTKGLPIRVIAIGARQATTDADLYLEDALGSVKSLYGIKQTGGAYLLRPDQHICARWQTLDEIRLHDTLHGLMAP